jgi:hypothetical protein
LKLDRKNAAEVSVQYSLLNFCKSPPVADRYARFSRVAKQLQRDLPPIWRGALIAIKPPRRETPPCMALQSSNTLQQPHSGNPVVTGSTENIP